MSQHLSARHLLASLLAVLLTIGCGSDTGTSCCSTGPIALRVINGYTAPVDVLIDGRLAMAALATGAIGTISATSGAHTLELRATGAVVTQSQSLATSAGAISTVAVLRSASGTLTSAILDDTNSVVPAGATKVRVLHFAPNAGTLQVFRTQPDYQQPISWQFPFTYQAAPTSLSAPFYQSTVGSWEVRIWKAPADSSGWSSATVRVIVPLAGGQKKTILILDALGGTVRTEVI